EAVGAEVVHERCLGRDELLLHSQLVDDDLLYPIRNRLHAAPPRNFAREELAAKLSNVVVASTSSPSSSPPGPNDPREAFYMRKPPSTPRTCPVMYAAAAESRNK